MNKIPPLPQTLTIEELLAELTLLTSADVIPPQQLLSIIAKSHVALTAQFAAFQEQQARETRDLRQAILELHVKVEERLEPGVLTRLLLLSNRKLILALGGMAGLISLVSLLTAAKNLEDLWLLFASSPAGIYIIIVTTFTLISTLAILFITRSGQK
jgi:hypothetical protein